VKNLQMTIATCRFIVLASRYAIYVSALAMSCTVGLESDSIAQEQQASAGNAKANQGHANLEWIAAADAGSGKIDTVEDWLKRRASIRQNVEKVMGQLPSRDSLPPLRVRVIEQVELEDGLVRQHIEIDVSTVSAQGELASECPRNRARSHNRRCFVCIKPCRLASRNLRDSAEVRTFIMPWSWRSEVMWLLLRITHRLANMRLILQANLNGSAEV